MASSSQDFPESAALSQLSFELKISQQMQSLTVIAGVEGPCLPILRKAGDYVYTKIRCRYCDATREKDIFSDC
jgi:hypothetical protein